MKRILLLGLTFLVLLSLVNAIPHSLYPAFAAPQSGFSVSSSGAVSASDDAVYKTAYYSTGGAWQAFSLTGNSFSGSSDWLAGSVSASLSFAQGTNYVVVYSCTRVNTVWDCHGGQWQLHIVDASGVVVDPVVDEVSVASVSASDFEDGGEYYPPEYTIDGDLSSTSRWSAEGDQWIKYDFSAPVSLSSVSILFYNGASRQSTFDIEVSSDGSSWTQVFSGSSVGSSDFEDFSFPAVTASFARINGHGNTANDWNALIEVRWNGGTTTNNNPTCSDGKQNQGETGIDCGGPCAACSSDPIFKETSICTDCGSGGTCSCTNNEYCSDQNVCLLTVPGSTYFVSTSGSDSNPGTYASPWGTWQKAASNTGAGDITYFRGGVWKPTRQTAPYIVGMTIRSDGTASNPVRFFNYPGEKPILDGDNIVQGSSRWNIGVELQGASHIHMKGLTVRQIEMFPSGQVPVGIRCHSCENIIYENLEVYEVDGRGIEHSDYPNNSGPDTTYWINVDVHDTFSYYENNWPGNAADGWMINANYPDKLYFIGCRAWNTADDGFDIHGAPELRHFKNCWSIPGDRYSSIEPSIEGNAYKLTGIDPTKASYDRNKVYLIMEDSIAADCTGGRYSGGFLDSFLVSTSEYNPSNSIFRNNLAYKCSYSIQQNGGESNIRGNYKNNVGWDASIDSDLTSDNYEHSHNTWDSSPSASNADFVSVDMSQLTAPRKPDGSLPDINFGQLAQGSDLIDAGTIISGYHCPSAGYQDGCRVWYGSAPDLGPFESNY